MSFKNVGMLELISCSHTGKRIKPLPFSEVSHPRSTAGVTVKMIDTVLGVLVSILIN